MIYWLLHPNNPKEERDVSLLELIIRILITIIFYPLHRFLHPDQPYFAAGSVPYLETLLEHKEEVKIFEFGTGTSTLWWADRVTHYTGVEHHQGWYNKTMRRVDNKGLIDRVELLHVPPSDADITINWENDWRPYTLLGRPPKKPEYLDYISAIEQFPDNSLDIISIDGRERVGSIAHAIFKIKPDGIIIVDDSSRPRYEDGIQLLKDWDAHHFDMGLQRTSIFTRSQ